MSADPVRQIADAVLYEGYVLWPYRRSALKNAQRFTFGGVYPRGWPEDRSQMRIECLLEAEGEPRVQVAIRFLQVVRRQLYDRRRAPVDELTVAGERHLSWEEAIEREFTVEVPGTAAIELPADSEEEELRDEGGRPAGVIRRSWRDLHGTVEADSERLGRRLHRISVRVDNKSRWNGAARREQVLRRTFCSTHAILHAARGAFVSLTDPPAELRQAAESCRNEGAWPVLVGADGERSTLLASPIILEDYPQVAPESPGDLFDGAEIDQLLTLNVLALTDEEKAEMRGSDPRVRQILERAESMSADQLMQLHGTIRDPRFPG